MKRISFTRRELDLILDMAAIAGANEGNWGDGDYSGPTWETKEAGRHLGSLKNKAHELMGRMPESTSTEADQGQEAAARSQNE